MSPGRPTTRWTLLAFGLSAVAILMSTVDSTIVATALPTLTRGLGTSIALSSLTITAYLAGLTIAMPITGRLSDSKGRKRMFLVYLAVFTTASLCCGLAPNIYYLVFFRFIQALGGGGFMPSVIGIASDVFRSNRERAIGLISSVFPLGALVGPIVGGVIVTHSSWRLIFLINVPVGIALVILLTRVLKADSNTTSVSIDYVGCFLLGVTLGALICGLSLLGALNPLSPVPWSVLAIGAVSAFAFVASQSHVRYPILPPTLLRHPSFILINSLNLLYGAAAIGIFSLVPLFAQVTYGMAPLQAGTLLSARAVGMFVISAAAALVLHRTGYRAPMVSGFILVGFGLTLMTLPPHWLNAYASLTVAATACGIGVGLAGPASNNAAIELMPDDVAAISGLRGMFRQVGGVVAISLVACFIARGSTAGAALRDSFIGLAVLMVSVTPAILWVPEPKRRRLAQASER